jgi:hypothetical protein
MAVDVSKIPNNDKFDPVRKALLNLQSQLEEEGQIAYDGEITIQGGTNMTSTPSQSFTVNQSGNSTITINADTQSDENFTTLLKDKLDNIEAYAQVNTVDSVNTQTGAVVLDTDDVQESATPTNKYYTEARFNASLAIKDTDDLSEGVGNLYYTDTRFDNRFATKDTDDLSEGATNFYYTEARFDASLAAKTTDDLTEGSNLYYTDARARAAISDGDGLDYNATTGVMSHTDTSSQSSVNNSNGVVIQDVSVDTFGHVTSLGSTDLDNRYPTTSFKTIEANTGSEVANIKDDTLAIKGGNLVNTNVTDVSGKATVTVDVSLTDVRFDENGDKIARGYLYWQGSTVPTSSDLPASSTFNFETNIITINDADWSELPPTTGYSLTTYYVTRYGAIDSGAGTTTARPVTYADPQDTTGFEGLVTFNSLSDELGASGLTIIDGGRIQTGEISSVGFNTGSTPTDYSTDGTLISLDSGNIISENFKIINGDADFRGDFSAATATIGDVEINTSHPNVFDVNLDAYIDRVIADGGTLEAIDGIYALSDDVNYALYSKNLKIDEYGNAAFSGKLRAADGTFTGNLVAATGTFGGELTAATGSFEGTVRAGQVLLADDDITINNASGSNLGSKISFTQQLTEVGKIEGGNVAGGTVFGGLSLTSLGDRLEVKCADSVNIEANYLFNTGRLYYTMASTQISNLSSLGVLKFDTAVTTNTPSRIVTAEITVGFTDTGVPKYFKAIYVKNYFLFVSPDGYQMNIGFKKYTEGDTGLGIDVSTGGTYGEFFSVTNATGSTADVTISVEVKGTFATYDDALQYLDNSYSGPLGTIGTIL